jgi:hypothetical protein
MVGGLTFCRHYSLIIKLYAKLLAGREEDMTIVTAVDGQTAVPASGINNYGESFGRSAADESDASK